MIAAVPGVDVLFVGPGDLSANMGQMHNAGAAPVKADADRYLEAGFTMVALGSDLGLPARGCDALIASFSG